MTKAFIKKVYKKYLIISFGLDILLGIALLGMSYYSNRENYTFDHAVSTNTRDWKSTEAILFPCDFKNKDNVAFNNATEYTICVASYTEGFRIIEPKTEARIGEPIAFMILKPMITSGKIRTGEFRIEDESGACVTYQLKGQNADTVNSKWRLNT